MSEHNRQYLDECYHDLFEVDGRGKAVFEDLYQRFYASKRVHTAGGLDAILKTYRDGAHKEVMDYIMECINRRNGASNGDQNADDE